MLVTTLDVLFRGECERVHCCPNVPFSDILPYETENTSNGRIQGATTFQGDILFRGASVEEYSLQSKRAVTRHDIHRWDNAVVPYAFDSMFRKLPFSCVVGSTQ